MTFIKARQKARKMTTKYTHVVVVSTDNSPEFDAIPFSDSVGHNDNHAIVDHLYATPAMCQYSN